MAPEPVPAAPDASVAAGAAVASADDGGFGLAPRQVALRLALVGGLFTAMVLAVVLLPFFSGVRDRFADAQPGWLVAVAVFQLLSEISFVLCLHAVFLRRLPFRVAWDIGFVEQGANVLLPTGGAGGVALGAVALGRAGLDSARVAARSVALFLLTSAASVATMAVAGTLTAVGLLGGDVHLVGAALPAAIGLSVLLFVGLSPRFLPELKAHEGHGRVRRTLVKVGGTLGTGVTQSLELLRRPDPLLLAGSLGYLLWDIASLAAAFHAFGGDAPAVGPFVLAYVVGQLGSLIPLPGGIGGTDGGLIGFMVLYGATGSTAAAAVLAFRVFQLAFPGILGAIALGRLRGDIAEVSELRQQAEAAEATAAS